MGFIPADEERTFAAMRAVFAPAAANGLTELGAGNSTHLKPMGGVWRWTAEGSAGGGD